MADKDVLTELQDRETQFDVEELFFSTTNLRGVIVHGNGVFVRISGYSKEELIGSPHSLVRHPDMPRCVFQLLWETIQAGRSIAAYVKNLAKDGTYYWVLALVIPIDQGYLSIRLKPTSALMPVVREIYRQLSAIEAEIGAEPKRRIAAMEAARAELIKQLQSHGFETYEKFMLHALSVELASRNQQLAHSSTKKTPHWVESADSIARLHKHCQMLDQGLKVVFQRLEEFKATNLSLAARSTGIRESAASIRFLSMNATVTASKLGTTAATLQVVSKSLGNVCEESREVMSSLTERIAAVVGTLDHLIFDLAATKLQSEVLLDYVCEIRSSTTIHSVVDAADERAFDAELVSSLAVLAHAMSARMQRVFSALEVADKRMIELAAETERLSGSIRTLRFVQFAGQKEAAAWGDTGSFADVFQLVREHINQTQIACDELTNEINSSCEQVRALQVSREILRPHFDSLLGLSANLQISHQL